MLRFSQPTAVQSHPLNEESEAHHEGRKVGKEEGHEYKKWRIQNILFLIFAFTSWACKMWKLVACENFPAQLDCVTSRGLWTIYQRVLGFRPSYWTAIEITILCNRCYMEFIHIVTWMGDTFQWGMHLDVTTVLDSRNWLSSTGRPGLYWVWFENDTNVHIQPIFWYRMLRIF